MLLFADLQYMPLFLNVGICYLSKTLAVGYPRYVPCTTTKFWYILWRVTTDWVWRLQKLGEAVGQTKEMSASTRPQSTQMFLSDNRWQSWHHSSRRSRKLEEEKNRISPKVLCLKYYKNLYLCSGTQKYLLKKKDMYSLAKLQKILVLHWRPNLPKDKKVQDLFEFL